MFGFLMVFGLALLVGAGLVIGNALGNAIVYLATRSKGS